MSNPYPTLQLDLPSWVQMEWHQYTCLSRQHVGTAALPHGVLSRFLVAELLVAEIRKVRHKKAEREPFPIPSLQEKEREHVQLLNLTTGLNVQQERVGVGTATYPGNHQSSN